MAVRVEGLRELRRDFGRMSKTLKRDLDKQLRQAGQVVADDARPRLARYDVRSAAGIGVRVRGGGRVVVEQKRRRVTGKRPDYGSLQMREALVPAVEAKQGEVERNLERMLDNLADRNGF
jgi:hypothetical protein